MVEGGTNSMKDLLRQYNSLVDEIKDLEKRIANCKNVKLERDSVKGSNPYFPYEPRTFTIEGYGIVDTERLEKLETLLAERKNQCEDMKLEIEKFISDIPDSRTRRVFQYRYVDGLSWLQIARRIGKYEESYPRKVIHDKYLEGLDKDA